MLITPKPLDEFPVHAKVSPASFGRYRPFHLQDAVMGYVYESDMLVPQRISKKDSIVQARALLDMPMRTGLHFITSVIDAERPNLLGSFVARRAAWLYDQGFPKKRRSLFGAPELNFLSGNFYQIDQLLRRVQKEWPITLVLTGLDIESPNTKIDACRDLINVASRLDASVVVLATGCTPHELQYDVLRLPPQSTILLGYPDMQKSSTI